MYRRLLEASFPDETKYKLEFHPKALDEFDAQTNAIQQQLIKKLGSILQHPKTPKNALRGALAGCYKVKLASAGVRLVYRVIDSRLVVLVMAVGKRADNEIYKIAEGRA